MVTVEAKLVLSGGSRMYPVRSFSAFSTTARPERLRPQNLSLVTEDNGTGSPNASNSSEPPPRPSGMCRMSFFHSFCIPSSFLNAIRIRADSQKLSTVRLHSVQATLSEWAQITCFPNTSTPKKSPDSPIQQTPSPSAHEDKSIPPRRARGVMLGLAPLLRPASSLNHAHKVRLFQACIMSLLLYAAPAWAYLPRYRFSPLQVDARTPPPPPSRTHTRVLLDLSGFRPLDVIIRGLAVTFFSRAQASPNAIVRGIGDYDPPALVHRRIRDGVVAPPVGYG
uniref:Uncharacterized protein n=1 Tax=Timema douglasi TaxID=61478 RepID=A0A7R8VJM1_TIMDO|nr:unnamed protein product [Timema douglasi]